MARLSEEEREVHDVLLVKLKLRGFQEYYVTGQTNCYCAPYHRGLRLLKDGDRSQWQTMVHVYRPWATIVTTYFVTPDIDNLDHDEEKKVILERVPHHMVTKILSDRDWV